MIIVFMYMTHGTTAKKQRKTANGVAVFPGVRRCEPKDFCGENITDG
jgi:hypothetical protein